MTFRKIMAVVLLAGATLTGASFTAVGGDSCSEYDVSATAVSGGNVLSSDYIISGGKNVTGGGTSGFTGKGLLSVSYDGTSSTTLTVAAIRTTATSASTLCALNWKEIR